MLTTKGLRRKQRLFKVFPSIVMLNVAASTLSILNTFVRMILINQITQNNSIKIQFTSALIILILAIFTENTVGIIVEAERMRIKHNYSMKAIEDISKKCSKLSLAQQESKETQILVKKADEYFKKALEHADAVSNFANLILVIFALLFLLRQSPLYIALALGVLTLLTFCINIRATKNTFGFWQRYMTTARRYNYFSDLQTKREFAYERRVYQTSQAMDSRFSDAFDQAAKINRKSGITRFWGQAISEGLIVSTTVFTFFYFAIPTSVNHVSLGEYAAITEMVSKLLACLSVCAESVFKIREFWGLYSELNLFLDKPEFLQGNSVCEATSNKIATLNNVSFRYCENTIDVISNITFDFEKGKHYGLVGINGSGKTTFVKLLLGLYIPCSGTLVTTCTATALFQDFQLYPITVREYLLMGNKKDISDNYLFNVLQQLNVINLKNGLDTMLTLIDTQGTIVSKGQLQKLAIARAFLSEADLIILDEPTANLDPISEREIYILSKKLLHSKTVIFISHRLGAVSGMDEILVMDKGKLIEHGTHKSLVALNGVYRKLYYTQKGMYVDEQ